MFRGMWKRYINTLLGLLLHWSFLFTLLADQTSSTQATVPWRPVDCPAQCVCRAENSRRNVYCDIQDKQADLTAVPATFPKDTQFLSLSRNKIAVIPVGAFAGLSQLRYLVLSHNELQTLHRDVFRGLTNLTSLNIANNNLSILPSGLLSGLPSLQDLYLDGNLLHNLPNDFLRGLTTLRRLMLNNNKFQTFSEQVFGFRGEQFSRTTTTAPALTTKSTTTLTPTTIATLRFDSLIELRLNHNGIGQVQDGSFNRMSDLKQLKLNDNNISTLPRGLFRQLKSLRLVSLYNNPFECTCSLKWLKHWIIHNDKKITVFHPDLIRCHGPPWLRGRPLTEVRDDEFGCPRRKKWTQWSSWSMCTKSCGGGRQSRTRDCTHPAHGVRGGCRESSRHWQVCNTQPCEPIWSVWSTWTSCSVTCSLGYQSRNRDTKCTKTPCERKLESDVRVCDRGPCPMFSEWSPWSQCDRLCGMGIQARTRTCSTIDGIKHSCLGPHVDTRGCKLRDCEEWAEWGSWTPCSTSCAQGSQRRMRRCITMDGSKTPCPGDGTEQRSCNLGECPVHGNWSTWSQWSNCSQHCGLGLKKRHRTCTNPAPQHGGSPCNGTTVEVVNCVQRLCTAADENAEFTQWSSWSECSTRCGTGTQTRSRQCTKLDPTSKVGMCLGNNQDIKQCEHYDQCQNNGTWGPWSTWSQCLGNCNQGVKLRFRFCVNARGQIGQYTCGQNNRTLDYKHSRRCKPTSCSYNPVWSTWSNWSGCSKSCSRGTKRRRRFCLTKVIGQNCPEHYESKESCNTHPCPIDGAWSDWSEWGKCSKQCEGGLKTRNRTCTNPRPEHNGRDCVGNTLEQEICNEHKCRDHVVGDSPHEIILETHMECANPEIPKHGKYTIRKQQDHNTYIIYKCDPYYRNKGRSVIRHCNKKIGEWNGEHAECVPDCGEIGNNALPGNRLTKNDNIMSMNESWPWQVAIKHDAGFGCGGSLVGEEWIVTAAHCILKSKTKTVYENITIYLGTNSLNMKDHSLPNVQVIPVEKVMYHEEFDWDIYNHDIAVLKLKHKVKITSSVHPVCLPRTRRRKQLVTKGNMGVVVGWGAGNFLRQIPLPVVSLEECRHAYAPKWTVTKKMLCAGYSDRSLDTCDRDSGGGFLFLDQNGRKVRWVLGGIVSWGYPKCGEIGKYSVFTSVIRHVDWIRRQIKDNR